MDRDYHTKWSKSDKANITRYYLYVESKKYDTNELIYKAETDLQTQKTNMVYKGPAKWH